MSRTRDLNVERVNESHANGRISDEILKLFYERLPVLDRVIVVVEKASGVPYPLIIFEPALLKIKYPSATFAETVIYASTKIEKLNGSYQLYVQLSLPFLLFASEDLLKAALAHEFLHYVLFTVALSKKSFTTLSGERLDSPEVHMAFDDTHVASAEEWLTDRELVDLIKAKFNPVISDKTLEADIKNKWEDIHLPVREITAGDSALSIPILELSKIPLDESIVRLSRSQEQGR